jgi:hypothetical protein
MDIKHSDPQIICWKGMANNGYMYDYTHRPLRDLNWNNNIGIGISYISTANLIIQDSPSKYS